MSYSDLLKDPRWQRRRLEILNRSDFSCEVCSSKEKTLHVHHKAYRKGAKPWEYEDHELIALCEDCHESRHYLEAEIGRWLAVLSVPDLERVLGYIRALTLIFLGGEKFQHVPLKSRSQEYGATDALSGFESETDAIEQFVHRSAVNTGGLSVDDVNRIEARLKRQ